MSASTVCKNGIGPGAISDTERTALQCPPTPPPLTANQRSSDVWSINPSNVSGTYDKKQDMGSALTFCLGKGAFDNTGDEYINHPFDA